MNNDLTEDQNLVRHNSNYYTTDEFMNKIRQTPGLTNNSNNSNDNNNSHNSFSLFHVNARSLNRNYDELNSLLLTINNFKFSAIGITETWLHSTSPPIFDLNNYRMIRADRTAGRGGGVAIYLLDHLKFRMRPDIHIDGAEDLFIEITNERGKNIIIGVIYRPPNNSMDTFLVKLDDALNAISQESKQIYLMGDFNIDLLSPTNQHTRLRLLNTLSSFSLHPHINKHTRITSTSSTLIDNIYSNIMDRDFFNGILYYDISDHLPIFAITTQSNHARDAPNNNKSHNMRRKETNHNIELLKSDLAQEQWLDIFQENNVNDCYEKFINKLLFYYDKNIPLVRQKNFKKIKNPWITKGIMTSIVTRNKLYKKALKEPNCKANREKYKKYRNKLTSLIRLSRKMYYSQKIESNKSNTNSLWQIIKDLIGTKTKDTSNTFINEGKEITDPEQISNIFNSYFVNIGPNLASKIDDTQDDFKKYLGQPFHESLVLRPTSNQEILNIVQSLKSSASTGYDGISVNLLKKIIHFIAEPVLYIFNLSITSGACPDSLKIAKVIPIFKKEDSSLVSNYRPISLLPAISKILEKILHARLYDFVTQYNLIDPNQYGFRKFHSTDFAIIQLYDTIIEALSKKEHCVGVFKDLSKAFDTINHLIMTNKLENYGVHGTALSWFEDYLTNRKQYVSFQSKNSQQLNIRCGVPQGSILGPLLFILYINDIVRSSPNLKFILFADDTNILYSHKNMDVLTTTINSELDKVQLWFKCNKLSLNISKTNFMYFRNVHTPPVNCNLKINDVPLTEKLSTKFLGVTIDANLNWHEHVHSITKSISKNIGILYKLKKLLSTKSLFLLYNALILPFLNYCNIVWGNCSQTEINSLFLLQKKAMRICSQSNYLDHTNPIFQNQKLLKVEDIHTYQTSIFMYKDTTNLLPRSFQSFFTLNTNIHSYPTRRSADFHLNNPKTLLAHKSIRHHGPDIWNSLPDTVKSRTSLHSFKASAKKYVLSKYNT